MNYLVYAYDQQGLNKEYMTDLYKAAKQHQQDNLFVQLLMGLAFGGMSIYCFVTKK